MLMLSSYPPQSSRCPLDVTIQEIPCPPKSSPIKSISLQFKGKDVVGNFVTKALQKRRETTFTVLPLPTDAVSTGMFVGPISLCLRCVFRASTQFGRQSLGAGLESRNWPHRSTSVSQQPQCC